MGAGIGVGRLTRHVVLRAERLAFRQQLPHNSSVSQIVWRWPVHSGSRSAGLPACPGSGSGPRPARTGRAVPVPCRGLGGGPRRQVRDRCAAGPATHRRDVPVRRDAGAVRGAGLFTTAGPGRWAFWPGWKRAAIRWAAVAAAGPFCRQQVQHPPSHRQATLTAVHRAGVIRRASRPHRRADRRRSPDHSS